MRVSFVFHNFIFLNFGLLLSLFLIFRSLLSESLFDRRLSFFELLLVLHHTLLDFIFIGAIFNPELRKIRNDSFLGSIHQKLLKSVIFALELSDNFVLNTLIDYSFIDDLLGSICVSQST